MTRADSRFGVHQALLLALCLTASGMRPVFAQSASQATLRVVPHADLTVLDPTVSSATITADHSYMVYDTLFALDDKLQPKPQMVESWSVSGDKLVYRFVLRDGLLFHDGTAVTADDCVASIKRWAVRDGTGQLMTKVSEGIQSRRSKDVRDCVGRAVRTDASGIVQADRQSLASDAQGSCRYGPG